MPKLVQDGQVKREGQGWHPAATSKLSAGLASAAAPVRRAPLARTAPQISPSSLDRVALLLELVHGGVDPRAGEVVDLQALDDLVVSRPSR